MIATGTSGDDMLHLFRDDASRERDPHAGHDRGEDAEGGEAPAEGDSKEE